MDHNQDTFGIVNLNQTYLQTSIGRNDDQMEQDPEGIKVLQGDQSQMELFPAANTFRAPSPKIPDSRIKEQIVDVMTWVHSTLTTRSLGCSAKNQTSATITHSGTQIQSRDDVQEKGA